MPDDPYTLADLARLADVTPRTIRYYVAQGLLPSPDVAGPATRYGEGHLARLRLIRRLQRDHLPLAEIRARLERLTDDEIAGALDAQGTEAPPVAMSTAETLAYVRGLMTQAGVSPRFYDRPAEPSSPEPSQVRPGEAVPAPASAPAFLAAPAIPVPPAAARAPLARQASAPPEGRPLMAPPKVTPPPHRSSAGDRSTWERLVITPDVEIHVRRPLDRHANKRVDQLARIARDLFEDEP